MGLPLWISDMSIADMGVRVWDANGRFGMGICRQSGLVDSGLWLVDRGIADDYGARIDCGCVGSGKCLRMRGLRA